MATLHGIPQSSSTRRVYLRVHMPRIAAAIAIPDMLAQPDPRVPNSTYLADDRLPEILNELDDFLRALHFIKDPSHPSFPLQLSGLFFDAL